MSTKQTPKSCSCGHCKRSKGVKTIAWMMNREEKRARRAAKQALKEGRDEDIPPAHRGERYG